MSYILDALRRADAERGRGGVPSLHTQQQFTPLEGDDEPQRPRARPIGWIAGGLAVALVGAVGWILLKPEPVPVAVQVPRPIAPVPSTAAAPAAGSTVPDAAPAARATSNDALARREPAPPASERHPARVAASRDAAPREASREGTARETPARNAAARPDGPASAAAAASADRVYAVRELPEDVRRALPTITVNGSTWSNDSASRMLMVGGQIYHEGDSIAPGVALERIKAHSAVLAFRGYRYELSF